MEWRIISNCINYSISDDGNVRNNRTGLILKQQTNDSGYCVVTLQGTPKRVHRLVALAFIPNTDNKRTVNHKDGNKRNNSVDNLEWNTHQENNQHSFNSLNRIGSYSGKLGMFCPNHKKVAQYDLKGTLLGVYYGCHEAGRETNSDYKKVSLVCRSARKTHNGFIWKYV